MSVAKRASRNISECQEPSDSIGPMSVSKAKRQAECQELNVNIGPSSMLEAKQVNRSQAECQEPNVYIGPSSMLQFNISSIMFIT